MYSITIPTDFDNNCSTSKEELSSNRIQIPLNQFFVHVSINSKHVPVHLKRPKLKNHKFSY